MKKVIILLGGISEEKAVSMNTGEAVYNTLKSNNIDVEKYVLTEDMGAFISFLLQNKDNIIVFNALHGKIGEDGRVQGVLDLLHIPYTHCGVTTSAIAMDKVLTKKIAKACNIQVAQDQIVKISDIDIKDIKVRYPFVIKPINEGSSKGIYLVHNEDELREAINGLSKLDNVMIEEYIKGVECTVGVMDGKVLAVTEIVSSNTFYDYNAKYLAGGSTHIIPARLPENITNIMIKNAEKIYKELGARGAIRVDFISSDTGGVYLLEVNTQPGLTETSLLPEQANHKGISFIDFCKKLIQNAKFDN